MTAPTALAYWIIGGDLLTSLLAPLILGSDGWLVPLATLPFCVLYAGIDKWLRDKEPEASNAGH